MSDIRQSTNADHDRPVVRELPPMPTGRERRTLKERSIYPFGVARNRLLHAAQNLRVPIQIVDQLKGSHVFLTTKQYYRKRPRVVTDAERRGVPIYVLRANTSTQLETFLKDLFKLSDSETDPFAMAMGEAEHAIGRVLQGEQAVSLSPQNAFVRRYQHDLAQKSKLNSRSFGEEPHRSVRIYRES